MIGPVIAGIIIANLQTNIGYMTVFSISLGLFITTVVISFFVNKRSASGKYCLPVVWNEIFHNKNWRNVLNANLFQGMREGLFVFVVTIWVFLVTKSEFALGMFNLCLSGFSFIFYFIVTKTVSPRFRQKSILIGCLVISLSIFIILFKISYVLLILYAIVIGMFYPVLNVPFNSIAYDVIGTSNGAKEYRIEYVVLLEVFTNIGRIFSVGVFIIFLSIFNSEKPMPYIMGFSVSLISLFIYLCVR